MHSFVCIVGVDLRTIFLKHGLADRLPVLFVRVSDEIVYLFRSLCFTNFSRHRKRKKWLDLGRLETCKCY